MPLAEMTPSWLRYEIYHRIAIPDLAFASSSRSNAAKSGGSAVTVIGWTNAVAPSMQASPIAVSKTVSSCFPGIASLRPLAFTTKVSSSLSVIGQKISMPSASFPCSRIDRAKPYHFARARCRLPPIRFLFRLLATIEQFPNEDVCAPAQGESRSMNSRLAKMDASVS